MKLILAVIFFALAILSWAMGHYASQIFPPETVQWMAANKTTVEADAIVGLMIVTPLYLFVRWLNRRRRRY
jgi:hypothetical protein